jgi:hypothetical protein
MDWLLTNQKQNICVGFADVTRASGVHLAHTNHANVARKFTYDVRHRVPREEHATCYTFGPLCSFLVFVLENCIVRRKSFNLTVFTHPTYANTFDDLSLWFTSCWIELKYAAKYDWKILLSWSQLSEYCFPIWQLWSLSLTNTGPKCHLCKWADNWRMRGFVCLWRSEQLLALNKCHWYKCSKQVVSSEYSVR